MAFGWNLNQNKPQRYFPKRIQTLAQAETYIEKMYAGSMQRVHIYDSHGLVKTRIGDGLWVKERELHYQPKGGGSMADKTYFLDVDRETVADHFEGILIPVEDIGGKYNVPGWQCIHCGWKVGASGLPPAHYCFPPCPARLSH